MPAPPPTARTVKHGKNTHLGPLARALDSLPVWDELTDETHWVELWSDAYNHVPAAIAFAKRRAAKNGEAREYLWEPEENGVRVWRTK